MTILNHNSPMKTILLSPIFLLMFLQLTAQNAQVVVEDTRSTFEERSYWVVKSLVLAPGFAVNASTDGDFFAKTIQAPGNVPPSGDQNFVRIEEVARSGVTSENQLARLDVGEVYRSFNYLDGIGRSKQVVFEQFGPNKRDIIEPITYDNKGRADTSYIVQEHTAANGAFKSTAVNDLQAMYGTESPYSSYTYENSPLNRVLTATGPGNDWRANNRSSSSQMKLNTVNEVRKWEIVSGLPRSTTHYGADQLVVQESGSEENYITRDYVDPRGLTVMSREGRGSSWLDTYFVYNDLGRLMFVIPPEVSTSYTPSADFANKWYYQFNYDADGNIISSKSPGTMVDWVYAVYDTYGRIVLVQDGLQRAKSPGEWSFFKYDDLNRIIMTGYVKDNASHATMISRVRSSTTNPHRFENTANTSLGYTTNRAYPTSITESDILTVNYYDNYRFRSLPSWDAEGNSYHFVNEGQINETQDEAVKGLATGSKVKILGSSKWLNSAIYYDDRYRTIQIIAENHLGGLDIVSIENDFVGRETKQVYRHTGGEPLTVYEEYTYDHAGRLLKTYHTINGQSRILLSSLTYNKRDELIEKNIYSTNNGASFLQSIDYNYNIRGWLEGMNDPLSAGENDLFGMSFIHNEAGGISTINGRNLDKRYDGYLSATSWQRNHEFAHTSEKQAFSYEYDSYDRLDRANYAAEPGGYITDGGKLDARNIGYDKNGNIKTLDRYDNISGVGTPIDRLGYQHNGNQLLNVDDIGNRFGFDENEVDLPTEYEYDENGNLHSDLNSEIIRIDYNYLDLPERIEFFDGIVITYTYDAAGIKLKKRVTKGSEVLAETDYTGAVQYEKGQLAFVFTNEGRAINKGDRYEYEFFYKDHLGNTRLTYGMLSEIDVYKATMENPLASQEESEFMNIQASRSFTTPNNHTPPSTAVPSPDRTAYLYGGVNVGPAKELQVKAGDHVSFSAYARFDIGTGGDGSLAPGFVNAVTNAVNVVSTGETQVIYDAFHAWLPAFIAGIPNTASNTPKAYLNYILFPKDYSGTPQFGYVPVENNSSGAWRLLEMEIDVAFDGHMYLYVANESAISDCAFDDVQIIHDKTDMSLQVSSAADYYPYGMPIASTQYVNEGVTANRYTYQSDFSEYDEYTKWHSFELRGNYDPRLGTWYSVDPYSQYASPYVGMGNSPVNGVDPDGGFFSESVVINALTYAATGAVAGAVYSIFDDNVDVHQAMVVGALAGLGAFVLTHVPKIIAGPKEPMPLNIPFDDPVFKVTTLERFTPPGEITVGPIESRVTISDPIVWPAPSSFTSGNGIEHVYPIFDLGPGRGIKAAGQGIKAGAKMIKNVIKNSIKEGASKKVRNEVSETAVKGVTSIVKQDATLLKLARQTFDGNDLLRKEANTLIQQLNKGNLNPGIGTKNIGKNIFEARSRGGARVYFRNGNNGIEILGYSNKANQQTVINRILKIY